ncbi:hypothetical protein Hypma_003648 [Hypsizygus marmoreus]|uniref:Uncharacterized protein n=1 Tax=Hypsizygus marmoreus TaxID=39966 RepID=A0A369J8K9_HYPMA|nr:hypothetical protein Hypma_003648 [Hypsizygus marmoreus]
MREWFLRLDPQAPSPQYWISGRCDKPLAGTPSNELPDRSMHSQFEHRPRQCIPMVILANKTLGQFGLSGVASPRYILQKAYWVRLSLAIFLGADPVDLVPRPQKPASSVLSVSFPDQRGYERRGDVGRSRERYLCPERTHGRIKHKVILERKKSGDVQSGFLETTPPAAPEARNFMPVGHMDDDCRKSHALGDFGY